jgi:hypothetical protein
VGESVCICGWVASQRSHGAVAFVNLRDHTGIVQVMGVFVFFPLHICPFFSLSSKLLCHLYQICTPLLRGQSEGDFHAPRLQCCM